ncbi:MAG: amidase domain-containing protein [Clostridia bacterium]|nr:amidase domain-containing protein [Clostridia bacterium]
MTIIPYDRSAAVRYAARWAYSRNPAYFNFSGIGGDCTNFVSQCLYAGAGVMNYTPDFGWYYISPDNRAAAWTGVEYLYNFLTTNESAGPFATVIDAEDAQIGDVIQLGNDMGEFYHTLIIVAKIGDSPRNIFIASHSDDSFLRRLSTYNYSIARYLHIEGVRKP